MEVDPNQVTLYVDQQRSEEPTTVQNNDEPPNINQTGSNEPEIIVISDERLFTSLIIKTIKYSVY